MHKQTVKLQNGQVATCTLSIQAYNVTRVYDAIIILLYKALHYQFQHLGMCVTN